MTPGKAPPLSPADVAGVLAENERLIALLNTPEIADFLEGVKREAAHQRERWGEAHDRDKSAENWFWLVGYLAGKALRSHIDGYSEKALHHTISSAAALYQWHAAIKGDPTGCGVGHDTDLDPDLRATPAEGAPTLAECPACWFEQDARNTVCQYCGAHLGGPLSTRDDKAPQRTATLEEIKTRTTIPLTESSPGNGVTVTKYSRAASQDGAPPAAHGGWVDDNTPGFIFRGLATKSPAAWLPDGTYRAGRKVDD